MGKVLIASKTLAHHGQWTGYSRSTNHRYSSKAITNSAAVGSRRGSVSMFSTLVYCRPSCVPLSFSNVFRVIN